MDQTLLVKRTGELDTRVIRVINVNQSIGQRLFEIGILEFFASSGPANEAIIIGIKELFCAKEKE